MEQPEKHIRSDYEESDENGVNRAQCGHRTVCNMPRFVGTQDRALEALGAWTDGRNHRNSRFPPEPAQPAPHMQRLTARKRLLWVAGVSDAKQPAVHCPKKPCSRRPRPPLISYDPCAVLALSQPEKVRLADEWCPAMRCLSVSQKALKRVDSSRSRTRCMGLCNGDPDCDRRSLARTGTYQVGLDRLETLEPHLISNASVSGLVLAGFNLAAPRLRFSTSRNQNTQCSASYI